MQDELDQLLLARKGLSQSLCELCVSYKPATENSLVLPRHWPRRWRRCKSSLRPLIAKSPL
jgi:hypothetical protein